MSSRFIADRRADVRFRVMNGPACTLLSHESLTILNLGTSGALVETMIGLPVHAELQMHLVLPTQVSDVRVKVRRITSLGEGSARRYQIGLEFLALAPDAAEAIDRLVAQAGAVC
jgi:hypothetical protein